MRMLDLFCCYGLGAWGYWRSGKFSEIVGVDVVDRKRVYPFDFMQADAIRLDYDFLSQFDFIHASPPCQAYSKITPHPEKHSRLILPTHTMLYATGKPYVIENVEGSSRELKPNFVRSGWDVGLETTRKRYFHLSWLSNRVICDIRSAPGINLHGDQYVTLEAAKSLILSGVDELPRCYSSKLTKYALEQGIPPAMTLDIANRLPFEKFMIG